MQTKYEDFHDVIVVIIHIFEIQILTFDEICKASHTFPQAWLRIFDWTQHIKNVIAFLFEKIWIDKWASQGTRKKHVNQPWKTDLF